MEYTTPWSFDDHLLASYWLKAHEVPLRAIRSMYFEYLRPVNALNYDTISTFSKFNRVKPRTTS